MNKVLSTIVLLSLLMIFSNSYADGNPNPDGKIKGSVAEAKTQTPVEYATVALYRAENNELISGAISDHLGHFKIDRPKTIGEYYLIISFIGLEKIKSNVFKVEKGNSNINLGNFFFESSSNELEEVEITAKKAAVKYQIDKKVINVDKQITSEAGTAVDVLENVPSVQVDVEGNVSLRGSSGFTVLIDGKPTILEPSDALRQIPSRSIENIEIITNPSVKYEPDGATGIINVITKKNRLDGLSGIVNTNVGSFDQYGGDFQLSFRTNKLNFILGANHNKRTRPGTMATERRTLSNDSIYYLESFGDRERGFTRSSIRGGVEYDLSKNDFISISGRYGDWNMNTNSNLRYNEWTKPVSDIFSYNSMEHTKRGGTYYSIDGVFQHTFTKNDRPKKLQFADSSKMLSENKKPGKGEDYKPAIKHVLNFEINYRNRDSKESSTNELRTLSDELIGGNKNIENGPSESIRFKLDYTKPVGLTDKFEAGLQGRSGRSKDATELWLYNKATSKLELIDEYSHFIDYNRNIYAAYGLYAGNAGKFAYQFGLRTEYTNRKIDMIEHDEFIIDRWDYFPSIHTSYNLPSDQQIMASYSRRIERPRGWWLEPFITWVDQFNVRQGNPDLKPQYIGSWETSYIKNFGDNFFSMEAYYRVTNNKVERIISVYQENVMLRKPENIGKDYSLGLEAMLNIGLFKWWDIKLSGNYYNYKLNGELSYFSGDKFITLLFKSTSTNWNSRFNNTFQLWKNGVLQFNSRYNSSSVTAQGSRTGYFTLDAAFRVSFLNKSLTANLQGRDILSTALRESTSEGLEFDSHYKYDPKSPVVALTISYRFNNFKASRHTGQNGGDDTDEL